MPQQFKHTEIASPSSLARKVAPHGQVVHASGVTPSSGLGEATATAAGQTGPTAALLVDHDAFASLTPRAFHSNLFGSVSARFNCWDIP